MPQGGKQCIQISTPVVTLEALSIISKSPCFKMKLSFYLKVEFPNIITSTKHINMELPTK